MRRKNYTTHDIARLLDVNLNTVATWVDEGKMKAFFTPGGHRRVTHKDLLEFFEKQNIPLPGELTGELSVLLVEDDPEVMDALKEVLSEREGTEVYAAMNGYDACEIFVDKKPAIVILDIMLPGIDGFEVCGKMKGRDKNVKIIAITGYPSDENRKRILECGCDAFSGPFVR